MLYYCNAHTGGGADALDYMDGNELDGTDRAIVITATRWDAYYLNPTSGASESGYDVIAPDTNPGTKRWIKVSEGA